MIVFVDRAQFFEAIDAAGLSEDNVREDYSGRGMYGSSCVGIVCDVGDLLVFAAALGSNADEWDWVGGACSDSMGLSSIWYWPSVSFAEEAS